MPEIYNEELAIEFERLENSSFKPAFFERMEERNYERFIEGEKYLQPEFADSP